LTYLHHIFFLFILIATGFSKNPDYFLQQKFRLKNDIYHIPPSPVYNTRPYFLEFAVDIPDDSIESVTIYHRIYPEVNFQMTLLNPHRALYRYKFDPTTFTGKNLEYFLIVTTKDFGIQAFPLDGEGWLTPATVIPVKPKF
tara:strand:+ start:8754 stop:9176 length:423 start_codon:yes stop_codon:yes gene_type:complete